MEFQLKTIGHPVANALRVGRTKRLRAVCAPLLAALVSVTGCVKVKCNKALFNRDRGTHPVENTHALNDAH